MSQNIKEQKPQRTKMAENRTVNESGGTRIRRLKENRLSLTLSKITITSDFLPTHLNEGTLTLSVKIK